VFGQAESLAGLDRLGAGLERQGQAQARSAETDVGQETARAEFDHEDFVAARPGFRSAPQDAGQLGADLEARRAEAKM